MPFPFRTSRFSHCGTPFFVFFAFHVLPPCHLLLLFLQGIPFFRLCTYQIFLSRLVCPFHRLLPLLAEPLLGPRMAFSPPRTSWSPCLRLPSVCLRPTSRTLASFLPPHAFHSRLFSTQLVLVGFFRESAGTPRRFTTPLHTHHYFCSFAQILVGPIYPPPPPLV